MKTSRMWITTLVVLGPTACVGNPILAPDAHGDYEVAVTFSGERLATLTEITLEVVVTDHDGAPVTDFEAIDFEFRLEGDQVWTPRRLGLHDGHYAGSFMFWSSGDHEVRIRAQNHGADHAETIYAPTGHMEVERIHKNVGEYRIEMETYPGQIHEGSAVEVKFWVLEAADGHAVGGMVAEIHFERVSTGGSMTHGATEHAPGVYEAVHTFAEHGETAVRIGFQDAHAEHYEAAFRVTVGEAH